MNLIPEYTKTGDWNAASNNAGISFGATVTTDFGYDDSKNHIPGVIQNNPAMLKTIDSNAEGKVDYDSWVFKNQYFSLETDLRAGQYIDFTPFKKVLGIKIGEYRESSIKADYYDNKSDITKSSENHYFEFAIAYGLGVDYKYNIGEKRFESISLSAFGISAEYSKLSRYHKQIYFGLDTGYSMGLSIGGAANIKGGWKWDWY